MAQIVVVEDSPDQARLMQFKLEKAGHTVTVARNGRLGVDLIDAMSPDLVITDLQMPEMDGFQLVEATAAAHPCLPVVLVTAFGSEEIAVQALRAGASSYIPKRRLDSELIETVENLLAIHESKRERSCVLRFMQASEFEFALGNDPSLIPPLVTFMEEILSARFGQESGVVFHMGVALSEAIMNAIHHGNLEVDSNLRETDSEAYRRLVRARLRQSPYKDRVVHVRASVREDAVQYTIRDQGPGFDTRQLPNPTDVENLLKMSGRGLYLISTFMDQVEHNDVGNEIVMVKRFSEANGHKAL